MSSLQTIIHKFILFLKNHTNIVIKNIWIALPVKHYNTIRKLSKLDATILKAFIDPNYPKKNVVCIQILATRDYLFDKYCLQKRTNENPHTKNRNKKRKRATKGKIIDIDEPPCKRFKTTKYYTKCVTIKKIIKTKKCYQS